jgi:putative transposase
MYYMRYPLSFRQVEDILHERGVDICHETVRFWVERFGSKFAGEIRKNRAGQHSNWQWHLDEVFVKINGERLYHFTMKVRFWNAMLQSDATRLQRRSS